MPNYVEAVRNGLADLLPDLPQDLLDLYTLLALVNGEECTLEDVHDAWAIWRNHTNPTHKSLISFDELTLEVQELDRKYMEAIHQAAALDVRVRIM